jgi:hypothetical protein
MKRAGMKHAGRTFLPGLVALGVGGLILFISTTTWIQMTCAMIALVGVALVVFAIATPEFLERDLDDPDPGD